MRLKGKALSRLLADVGHCQALELDLAFEFLSVCYPGGPHLSSIVCCAFNDGVQYLCLAIQMQAISAV